ncbi:uncharacterized protein TrAtP1_002477 [Trichoderma atroviride]|uniref:uncharacterized protein n=1 Tax=Hypocrea atroviridis TaxID=63577 RepID=UPI003328AD84|nr:hypothetical protein TrAtP1_002477 [Trichoderma atroviride]
MATPAEKRPGRNSDIYDIVIDCTVLFELLAKRSKLEHDKNDIGDEKRKYKDGKTTLEDQISSSRPSPDEMKRSFNIWIDNTGALAADPSRSLDTRLHTHRDIKKMITNLLQMLVRNIEFRKSTFRICVSLKKLNALTMTVLVLKGESAKPTASSSSDSDDDDLEDEARDAIEEALDELHFMAAAIRRSSVRSQEYSLSSHFHRDDDSYFQEQVCLVVRYYFRDARRSLCEQLGASLAIRRSKFFQRMRHDEKLGTRRNPEEFKQSTKPIQGPVGRPQQLIPEENLPKQKPTVPFKAPLASGDTRSQLDSEVARHHLRQGPALSTISTGSSIRLSSAIYPDKPKFADGDINCKCPYCARPLTTNRLKNDPKYWQAGTTWTRTQSPTSAFLRIWHRNIHMTTWYCDVGHEAVQFNDHESFVRHLKDPANHTDRDPPTDLQLDTLSRRKKKILVRDEEYCCPICECVPKTLEPVIASSDPDKIRRSLYEHIAVHIKDLALKSIPTLHGVEPSEDKQSEVDDGSDRRLRGEDSTASYPSGLDMLRQETSLAFEDGSDGVSGATEDEDLAHKWDQSIITSLGPSDNPTSHLGTLAGIQVYKAQAPKSSLFRGEQSPHRLSRAQSRSSESDSLVAEGSKGRLFDATDSVDQEEIQKAKEWFRHFETIKHELPGRARLPDERIRIGVLDTGIDLDNSYISQTPDRVRCWPPEANHHDNDGHGTHVAYLLLELTRHADLRICKIADSRSIQDADVQRMAEAITHFSQRSNPRGQDDVDILALPFCFPRYDDVLKPINDAIRKARESGIIIFAASGNEYGDTGLSWPASLHETGDVIRISSSDGRSPPSGFNLSPEIGRWICTLGQGVPSCQVGVDTDEVIYRSGSSFATAIAAAIAAIILGVVDSIDASQQPDDLVHLRPRLRTRLGMERVLCETCVQIGLGESCVSLAPWCFFGPGKQTQIHIIVNILSHVSG